MDSFSSAYGDFRRAMQEVEPANDAATDTVFLKIPRGGRTNEFASLFGTEEEQQDYIIGILILALIISCFFLAWFLFLCIFKCLGKKRVGFLSGGPYDTTLKDGKTNPRPSRGRAVFGLSGLCFIAFTLCMVFLGLGNLEDTTDELADGARISGTIFTDSRSLLSQFLDVAQEAANTRDILVDVLIDVFETGNITVGNTTVDIPNKAVTATKFIIDDINFQEEATEVVKALYALDDLIQGQSQELNLVIDDGEQTCTNVADGLDEVTLRQLQLIFGVPYTVLPLIMLFFLALTILGVNNSGKDCCLSIFFMPIFIAFTILLVILTMGFSVGGIVDGDFCNGGDSNSPDATLLQIMDNSGIDPLSLEYRVIAYLVNGCQFDEINTEFPLEFIEAFEAKLDVAEQTIRTFGQDLETVGIAAVGRALNGVNVTDIDNQLTFFRDKIVIMLRLLEFAIKELACQRLYEVYSKVIHDATCDTSYKGLVWSFSALLVMAFSGGMMITFRAALYPTVDATDDADDKAAKAAAAGGVAAEAYEDDEVDPVVVQREKELEDTFKDSRAESVGQDPEPEEEAPATQQPEEKESPPKEPEPEPEPAPAPVEPEPVSTLTAPDEMEEVDVDNLPPRQINNNQQGDSFYL